MTFATSQQIALRRLSAADAAPFRAYREDPDVAKFQGWEPMEEERALGFLSQVEAIPILQAGKWTQLGLALRENNQLIGDVGIHISQDQSEAELGITLASDAQGQSLGYEAVELVCTWLFEQTQIKRIVAITHARNKRALALLARTPFVHTHDTNDLIDGTPTPERWFERRRT